MAEEWITGLAEELDGELRARAAPGRAAGERAYLKSELTHYGASVPAMRAAVRAAMAGITLGHDELVALVEVLWAQPVHERRAAAVELLDAAAALECGGLARAVVADECADLAGADVQAEVLHGRLAAVGLGQMFDVEHKVPSFVRGSAPLCP